MVMFGPIALKLVELQLDHFSKLISTAQTVIHPAFPMHQVQILPGLDLVVQSILQEYRSKHTQLQLQCYRMLLEEPEHTFILGNPCSSTHLLYFQNRDLLVFTLFSQLFALASLIVLVFIIFSLQP